MTKVMVSQLNAVIKTCISSYVVTSWLTIALAMGGEFFATITFFVVYLITAELFPTVLRASVIGVCSMAGRTGSIASAYVGEIVSLLIVMAVVVIWR
jgi:OCT family organic cation transporter-like MFS transporter 4/5